MAESWLQKRARLKREKAAAEAKKKAAKFKKDVAEGQRIANEAKKKNQIATQRAKREARERRRNQGGN